MREEKEQKIAEIAKELDEYDAWIEKHPEHKGRQGKFPEWCRILQKENQKLREEQEFAKREAIRWNSEASNFKEERNYYKEIYRHEKNISTYEIKRLEQVIEQQKWLLKREGESIEQLQQREQKLIEGLRWYGDKRNYHNRQIFAGYYTDVNEDEGQRARDILTEIGVTE